MKPFKILLLLLLTCTFLVPSEAQELVINHVNIITMQDDQVLEDHSIYVKDGVIMEIAPEDEITVAGIRSLDGRGMYIFPGLAEFHAHLPNPEQFGPVFQEEVLWMYLANGVLRIRSMLGHESHLELKKRVEAGELTGPRMFISGPSLNGTSVADPDSGRKMVRDQKAAGYDHLKLHPGLDDPKFLAIADEAKKAGIYYGGHVSLDVGLVTSVKNGYRSVEHIDGFLEAMLPDGTTIDPTVSGPFNMNLVGQVDQAKLDALIQLCLENKTWIAPTLTLFERYFGYQPAYELRQQPEMFYLPGQLTTQWYNTKSKLEADGVLAEAKVKPYLEFRQKLFLDLHKAGVPMIMSSDSPQVFNVPGFSIHREIESMSKAGMSNYEILKTGSVNCADYFEESGEWGVLKPGAAAEFVMVQKNPLEDLTTMQKPQAIMIQGKFIQRDELQLQLNLIRQKYLRQ
ncbi:imidazolonepropionase-like amidohydrolase [Algoriphagus boseongensis]|uniref:Imidazolonepropionase-like amidohydrolase n=1 Tax=Algoriphagus boseongensis TaxID=1442587 RepID=A0A4V3D207_9BACT|nr:amidohydrolase family protein [Algoriphagus boseongensis]TDQ16333.1 imidazolonepropionase-like amidohydrolase [Algoriphagus boseongensis]